MTQALTSLRGIALALAAILLLAGCTATERGAAVGAGTGAVIGGATTGNVRGAAVGAGIGAVAGALIGRASEPGRCRYRDRRTGRVYIDDC